jgi:hypothetical protein
MKFQLSENRRRKKGKLMQINLMIKINDQKKVGKNE